MDASSAGQPARNEPGDAPSAPQAAVTSGPHVWLSAAAGAAVLGVVVWLAWQAGGYFPPDYLTAGTVVFAMAGVILLIHVPRYRLSTEALVALGALSGFAAWSGLSATWSPSPDAALEAMQRNVVHVGLFGLALLAAGSGRHARQLVWAVLAAICVISGAGLLSRLFPDLVSESLRLGGEGPYRLSHPWTYWNAAGAMAAMGTALATGLAADPRARVPLRAVAAGAAVPLAVTMYLTFSRGAWLALIVGAVVLVILGAHRGSLVLTLAIVGAGVTVALLRLRGYPALTDDPTAGSGQADAGRAYAVQLLLVTGAAVAGQWAIAAGRASYRVMDAWRRVARPVGIAAAVLIALFAIVTYGLRAGSLEGWTANRLDDSASWVSDQWHDFLTPALFDASGAARLRTARGTRSDAYRVAFDAFEENPVLGEGAGSFEQRWIRERDVGEDLRNAHSLELETLGELGLVGILLLGAFIAAVAAAMVRSRRRPGAMSRAHVAAVGAGVSVWLAQASVDWSWQMSGLTGMALVLSATVFPYGRRRRRRRSIADARSVPWA